MNNKYYANRGLERNKKPLQNIVYTVEIKQLKEDADLSYYLKYKFKEEGYLVLKWQYEKDLNKYGSMNFHGCITPDDLRELLGPKQWAKFCSGKRLFIIQRRENGINIKKQKI